MLLKTILLLLIVLNPVYSQFGSLAVTDDGGQVYFVTTLRLKSEAGLNLPKTAAIYRFTDGRVERFTEPPFTSPPNFPRYDGNPQVSGGGGVVSYTHTDACIGGSNCELIYPTQSHSYLYINGQRQNDALGGDAQISRNGRYVLNAGGWWSITAGSTVYRDLRDLQTGGKVQVQVWPLSGRQAITKNGQVLGADVNDRASLNLWSTQGVRKLLNSQSLMNAIINDDATWVAYETRLDFTDSFGRYVTNSDLRVLELSTGHDYFLIHRSTSGSSQPSISNDGRLLLYVSDGNATQPAQVWLVRLDGLAPMSTQLTSVPEGISEAVLTGIGKLAVAVTKNGRVIRVDTTSGAIEELIGPTQVFSFPYPAVLVPGSLSSVNVHGLVSSAQVAPFPLPVSFGGIRVLVDGLPMPILSVTPDAVHFQAPFEMKLATSVTADLENQSIFDPGSTQLPVVPHRLQFYTTGNSSDPPILVHQDFRSLVTRDSPVRPGEIIHAYASGLGAVTPKVDTGAPTPASQLFRIVDPFDCTAGYYGVGGPIDVIFAGLAPGMLGIYQVSMRMPEPLPASVISNNRFYFNCGTPGNVYERAGGYIPVPPGP